MERFRSFVKSAFSYPGRLFSTHPVTTVSIVAATVLFAVYTYIEIGIYGFSDKANGIPLDVLLHVSIAVAVFAVLSLAIESIRAKWRRPVKYTVFALAGLLSLFLSFLLSDLAGESHLRFWEWLGSIRAGLGTATIIMYILGLVIIAVCLAVYFSYSHDIHQPFNDHMMNSQASIFFASIIYGVIQLGVIFLTLIVTLLLYDDAFEYITPVLILINGLFYVPAMICALIHENEKANKFFEVLVRYVSLIISMLAYLIIYIYIFKLIITRSVPSNSVFAILSALFVISMFISYLCTTFENRGLLQKFAFYSPLIFAPFIIMQCYTMIARIGQYGLTPMRYFGIAFIIFEIVYIVYYTVEYKKIGEIAGRNLLLVICAFALLTVFVPGVNARSFSTAMAKRALSNYLDKASASAAISDREYTRANAAMGFLRDDDFGKERLEKYFPGLDEDTVEALKSGARTAYSHLYPEGSVNGSEEDGPVNCWFNADIVELSSSGEIDISGYDKMMYVNVRGPENGDGSDDTPPVDTTSLQVYAYDCNYEISANAQPVMTVDLSDFCTRFMELTHDNNDGILDYDSFRRDVIAISVIDINENARLYIINADISQNAGGKPVRVDLCGYLFVK